MSVLPLCRRSRKELDKGESQLGPLWLLRWHESAPKLLNEIIIVATQISYITSYFDVCHQVRTVPGDLRDNVTLAALGHGSLFAVYALADPYVVVHTSNGTSNAWSFVWPITCRTARIACAKLIHNLWPWRARWVARLGPRQVVVEVDRVILIDDVAQRLCDCLLAKRNTTLQIDRTISCRANQISIEKSYLARHNWSVFPVLHT